MNRAHTGRNIVFAYFGIGVPGIIALVLVPHLIRNLGKARFGLLSLLLSVAAFFMAFDFGTGTAVARYTSRLSARPANVTRIRRLIDTALLMQAILGLGIGTVLLVLHRVSGYADAAGDASLAPHEVNVAVALVAASIPFALVSGAARCALEGLGRFGLANTLRAPASASTFVAPIALSFATPRLDVLMCGLLLARGVTTALFIVALRSQLRSACLPMTMRYTRRCARVLLAYGGWVTVGVAAGGLVTMGIVDRLLISKVVGSASIIEYSLPSDVVVRCLLAPAAITSVLIPFLAHTVAASRPLPGTYKRSGALLMGQVGPLSLILLLNAERLLRLLAREHVDATSVSILQAMAIGLFVHSVAHVPYAALHALGRPNYASIRHVMELPVYAVISYVLLRIGALAFIGALWAAWALCDLWLISCLLRAASSTMKLRLTLRSPTFVAWCAVLVAAAALSRLKLPGTIINGVSLCAFLFWCFKVTTLLGNTNDLMGARHE